MHLGYSLGRGLRFGANAGAAVAIIGLFTGPLIGVAFGPMIFGGMTPVIGSFLGMAAEAIAGTLVGAALGAAVFGTSHLVTNLIPALGRIIGDTTPLHPHVRMRHSKGLNLGQSTQIDIDNSQGLSETNERNTGFRRMIEEQQQMEEMQRDQTMGR